MAPDERRTCEARLPPIEGGRALFAAVSTAVEPALMAAAEQQGRVVTPVSLMLAFAAPASPGEALIVEAWVERATRTLVFAAAEARNTQAAVVASASAVFKLADTSAAEG